MSLLHFHAHHQLKWKPEGWKGRYSGGYKPYSNDKLHKPKDPKSVLKVEKGGSPWMVVVYT